MFSQDGKALLWRHNYETLRIEPWCQDSLRVRITRNAGIRDDLPNALLPVAPAEPTITLGADAATIRNGAIQATVSASGALEFRNAESGQVLLGELLPEIYYLPPTPRQFRPGEGDLYHIEAAFAAYDDERLYGLGQQPHGRLDQKGCVIDLVQRNTRVCIPFLLSSRGYGFLWNMPGMGRVELGINGTRWIAEAARQMDYWITVGRTPADILRHYADATGHPPLLPEWATGFWQSKLRYRTQAELLEVAREYRRRGLPLSVIVIDYFHWTLQGDWKFDPECWPDPAAMVQELDRLGVKVMVSIWPTVNPLSENFAEMDHAGYLVRSDRGVRPNRVFVDNRPSGPVYVHFYDAMHPAARDFIWQRVRENYYRYGIKLWWLDTCEPQTDPEDPANMRYYLGSGAEVTNLYPLLHARAFFEGMQTEGETEIVLLSRSAWAGSQRYGAAVWSGDIAPTWDSLRRQVRAGLNIALSGIPWWTTDIGGFEGGDPDAPGYRELIVRWFQFGTFCPIFRLHGRREPFRDGTGGPNEVWAFGDAAYGIMREFLFLRERLRPYILAQMCIAHETGLPPMRPLFVDFPDDTSCWAVDDQFMFGPDLLVAPVLYAGATERQVYLPAGAAWTDAWTGTELAGGQMISASAPLNRIPLYLRAGASLPIRLPVL
jgi:alpha-D-xyloside xylohydrolase